MPRYPRNQIAPPRGIFHIINRGNNRSIVFYDDDDFLAMAAVILACMKKFGFFISHYVFMSNHYHFVLEVFQTGELSNIMKAVNQMYAIHHKKKYGNIGRLWQDRFKSYVVDTDAYLSVCGVYVELNPVRANMVASPEEYQWSSYRAYAYGAPDPLVKKDILYAGLGETDQERQTAYRKFTTMWQSIGAAHHKKMFES